MGTTFNSEHNQNLFTKHATMKSFIKILFLNLFLTTTIIGQDDEYGIASYYSDLFHGKPTASGELYDKGKLTAAHKTLPFGTLVKVTRLDDNSSVQVRVNDRGPFISGRIIELSREAATRVHLIKDGATRVKVEIVNEKPAPDAIAGNNQSTERPKAADATDKKIIAKEIPNPAKPASTSVAATEKKIKVNEKPSAPASSKTTAKSAQPVSKSVLVKGQDYTPLGLFEIELKRPEKTGYGVQVAALTNQNALFKKIADLQGAWFSNILVNVDKGDGNDLVYKIILGSFETQKDADVYKANLKKNKKIDGFVVDLSALDQ